MKYRVRVELAFESEADARALMVQAKNFSSQAMSVNASSVNAEISFCELELCHHDERLPCVSLERVEVS